LTFCERKRRPRGAFFISALSGLLKARVSTRVDNIRNQNYFLIREFKEEKEVRRYGMGINEHSSF